MPEEWVLAEEPGEGAGGDCLATQLFLGRIRYPLRCSHMRPDVVVSLLFLKKAKAKDRTDGDGNELAQGCPRYSFCTTLLGRVDCNRTALPRGRVLRKRCGSFHLRLVGGTSPSSV